MLSKLVVLCLVVKCKVGCTCVVTLYLAAAQLTLCSVVLSYTGCCLLLLSKVTLSTRVRVLLPREVLGSVVRSTGQELLLTH